jgi:methylase of polypeptide subunit release factors
MNSLILLPQPRHCVLGSGSFRPEPGKHVALVGALAQELLFSGERLRDVLHSICSVEWTITAAVADADQMGTGVDFSPEAIRVARGLSQELGIAADFVLSNVYDLSQALTGKFDIVFTS